MPEFPLALLEDLASKEAQVRWIVHATVDEYLLPDELLHDADRFCEMAARIDEPTTARQRAAIAALRAVVADWPAIVDGYDRSNIAILIEQDPKWNAARERAADVIRAFASLPYD